MGEETRVHLNEMVRGKRSQERISRDLFKRARELGGYVVLHVPLPFKLPLHDGFHYGWDPDEPRFLELIHYPQPDPEQQYEFRVGEPIFEETDRPVRASSTLLYTVARLGTAIPREEIDTVAGVLKQDERPETVAVLPEGLAVERDLRLEGLLDGGLRALNLLIRAYRVVTNDLAVSPVRGLGSLPSILMYTLWDVSRSRDLAFGVACLKRDDVGLLGKGIYLVNKRVPLDAAVLGFEDTAEVVALASGAVTGSPHPFFASADLLRSAAAKLEVGDGNGTIVESVTAVEIFVSTLLRLDLEHRGRDKQQVNRVLDADLKSKLKDHLARKMLGMPFDARAPGNPLDRWYADTYGVRSEVVHRGLSANTEQARRAFAQSQDLLEFLTRKVRGNPKRFPQIRDLLS